MNSLQNEKLCIPTIYNSNYVSNRFKNIMLNQFNFKINSFFFSLNLYFIEMKWYNEFSF